MKLKLSSLFLALLFLAATFVSCGGSKDAVEQETATTTRSAQERGTKGMKKTAEETITAMDADGDGMLSKTEVKGRIADRFDTIDTDGDGKLSLTELKNAPKPPKKNRGRN